MHLEIFLADFAVFRVFWGISRDFAEIPEFRGSATARRASDISRKKKQNFAGFSGVNSRKNRPISRDFRGKKVKIRGTIGRFRAIFVGKKVKIHRKIGPFRGILAEKSQFSKDFQGQILRKIGRFHGKFRGETSPRNNQ